MSCAQTPTSGGTTSCPDTGTSNGSTCTFIRKLCVTCKADNGVVYIRMQSNNLPSHCYKTPADVEELNIDYRVKWMHKATKVSETHERAVTTQTELDEVICNIMRSKSTLLDSSIGYTNEVTGGRNE